MNFYQKCIPDYYYKSIYEILYHTLQEQGIKTLFFDLDNTIISYDEDVLSQKHIDFLNELSKIFKIVVLSNSGYQRVSNALKETNFPFVYHATKPLQRGFKKALKLSKSEKHEVLVIGDQLMTDVLGAHRTHLKVALIESVKRKSDRKITQFNRKIEKHVLKKIEKKYPDIYESRLEAYVKSTKV